MWKWDFSRICEKRTIEGTGKKRVDLGLYLELVRNMELRNVMLGRSMELTDTRCVIQPRCGVGIILRSRKHTVDVELGF